MLHTWGQTLVHHPHVHCVIPAGGLSPDHTAWISLRYRFFLPVEALSIVFRGKFVDALEHAYRNGKLCLPGALKRLRQQKAFRSFVRSLHQKDWVVYAKPPFGGPRYVLNYLARYTHRVAISNHRLVSFVDGKVTFRWKDYAHGSKQRLMTLTGEEFPKRYRVATRPPWARIRMLRFIPRCLWRQRGFFWNTLWAILSPERAHGTYQRKVDAFEVELTKNVGHRLPLAERRTYAATLVQQVFDVTMAALMASLVALGSVGLVIPKKSAGVEALAEKLKRGFTGNVVAEMGIALFRLAKLLDRSDFEDLARLAERVEKRQMAAEFLSAWDAFLSRFGWRGPAEMDLASPRYADDPGLALRQMSFMTVDDGGYDPEAAHKRQVEERRRAYAELMSRSGWLRRALLHRIHRIIELFAGSRDMPKHHNLLLHYAVRRRALIEGRRLATEGRLDAAEDVFDLTFRDLESAALDPSLDLRAVREERTRFIKILAAQVTEFPPVIDSRGRILRPRPREERPGELSGMAVSPGVVTGPVKLLHSPNEKPVNKGDVLVVHTADPGWTPLFVNAAAVVLEVGGVLQHGAVIAREYGKPCVVGIDGIMTKIRDGQSVEVDGTAGVIRLRS